MPFAEFSIVSVFLRRRGLLRDLALSCHEHLLEASGMTPQAQNKIVYSIFALYQDTENIRSV